MWLTFVIDFLEILPKLLPYYCARIIAQYYTVLDTTLHFIYRVTLFFVLKWSIFRGKFPIVKKRHSVNKILSRVQHGSIEIIMFEITDNCQNFC